MLVAEHGFVGQENEKNKNKIKYASHEISWHRIWLHYHSRNQRAAFLLYELSSLEYGESRIRIMTDWDKYTGKYEKDTISQSRWKE